MQTVVVNDKMQSGYTYVRDMPMGKCFDDGFEPYFTPKEMLHLGIFEGKYLNDCIAEFPKDWFETAQLSGHADISCNYFRVKSRQPLSVWRQKGWILEPDPRGWFQWYCRYFSGRRIGGLDQMQIKRWRGFARHSGQIKANCAPGDIDCRPRQRQALLQWSHNPFI